ncbi:MAG: tyrosine transporter [Bacillota bacterium]|nr:tyrosine transporter [Bacillota bacterium]
MKTTALIIFVLTYVLLLGFSNYRHYVAICSGLLFVALGILPLEKVTEVIDWNVIMMIAGTMGVVNFFIESKMPSLLADNIIERSRNVMWSTVFLSLFAGVISAFVDNVATVLMIAPVAVTIAKKLHISPVPSVICIAISSNLQGAATLVGDTTSILLGGHANMNFLDFFFFKGRLSIFWAVEIGAIISILVLLYLFRNEKRPIKAMKKTRVEDFFPTVVLLGIIVLLIAASFIPDKPTNTNGFICMTLFFISLLRQILKTGNFRVSLWALKEIDFTTLFLLTGLFIVIGSITEVGLIEDISKAFLKFSGGNLFVIYTILVWASVIFSGFIDNIPYVATMLPVTGYIASYIGVEPYILYFGLLIGATLGGNLTPVGASANITGIGILRKEGYDVSTKEFMKYSVPFTLSAVISGYLFIWFIWS